jgi:hypothetical protein
VVQLPRGHPSTFTPFGVENDDGRVLLWIGHKFDGLYKKTTMLFLVNLKIMRGNGGLARLKLEEEKRTAEMGINHRPAGKTSSVFF